MRARWTGPLVGAGALTALVFAVGQAPAARIAAAHSLSGKITLPGSGHAVVDEFTITASVPNGHVGSLRIRVTNESQLPSDIRAVAAISPKRSSKRRATFEFFIAINNLGAKAGRARAAADQVMNYQVYGVATGIKYKEREIHLKKMPCDQLRNESDNIDVGVKNGSIALDRLQRKANQPSPSEEVFDFSASNVAGKMKPKCTGVEGPDSGND